MGGNASNSREKLEIYLHAELILVGLNEMDGCRFCHGAKPRPEQILQIYILRPSRSAWMNVDEHEKYGST